MLDPKVIVEAGYDAMADGYADFARNTTGDPRPGFLADLLTRLDDRAAVVDLGCGSGLPSTRELARRHAVLGIDLSAEQLRRARENVPGATFRKADFATMDLPAGSLDAVAALYSLTHVPREEHGALFRGSRGGSGRAATCWRRCLLPGRATASPTSSACRCTSAATIR